MRTYEYVNYIGKTAQRAGTPLMDIVSLAFEGIAGKWAQQFAKSLPTWQVNDARFNKEVYNEFHKAFLTHFRPQVRTQEKRARDDLYGSKVYRQKASESVALYATRFRTVLKDAGGVKEGTDAYLFREGLKPEVRDQVNRLGRPLTTLDECISASLKAEDILLEHAKSTNQALNQTKSYNHPQGSGAQVGQGRGRQGGRGREGGRFGGHFGGRGQGSQGYQGRDGGRGQGRGEGRGGGRNGQGEEYGKSGRYSDGQHDKGRVCTHPQHGLHATCTVDDVSEDYPNPPPLAGALGGPEEELCWISTPDPSSASGLRWLQVPRSQLGPRQA